MKIGAVIAEYNPFHSGHAYQIRRYKEAYHPDAVIAIMSEDYVQRGEPACTIYENRVRAALSCGVDLVIGLPVWFSTASAGVFAAGGVSLLNACGCIDELFFGCDSSHSPADLLSAMQTASYLLEEEPLVYKETLNKQLRQGSNFALARSEALKACGMDSTMFDTPNNILALSYISALRSTDSSITPVLIPRTGSAYHDLSTDVRYPSASAIRKAWSEVKDTEGFANIYGLPENASEIYRTQFGKTLPVTLSDFDGMFAMSLHTHSNSLLEYADMSQDMANRINKFRSAYTGLVPFIDTITNKSLTKTRVSRACLHTMLHIRKELCQTSMISDHTAYLRILGFKKDAAWVLKELHDHSSLPIITKPSDYQKVLSPYASSLFETDIDASILYRTAARMKFKTPDIPHPFTSGVIIS